MGSILVDSVDQCKLFKQYSTHKVAGQKFVSALRSDILDKLFLAL